MEFKMSFVLYKSFLSRETSIYDANGFVFTAVMSSLKIIEN